MDEVARFYALGQPFLDFLNRLPQDQAKDHVCLLVLGAMSVVQSDRSAWLQVRTLVCSVDIMRFCKRILQRPELADLIDWVCQTEDVLDIVGPGEEYEREVANVINRANELLLEV